MGRVGARKQEKEGSSERDGEEGKREKDESEMASQIARGSGTKHLTEREKEWERERRGGDCNVGGGSGYQCSDAAQSVLMSQLAPDIATNGPPLSLFSLCSLSVLSLWSLSLCVCVKEHSFNWLLNYQVSDYNSALFLTTHMYILPQSAKLTGVCV